MIQLTHTYILQYSYSQMLDPAQHPLMLYAIDIVVVAWQL